MTRIRKDIPFVSVLLVLTNIIVFFMTFWSDNMHWGKWVLGTFEVLGKGEYSRLITSMFMHADLEHLFNNMLILFFLGAMLEKEIGHFLLLMVYMLSGLIGSIFSMGVQIVTNSLYYSLGASGAVFGLNGLLLAIVVFAGKRFPDITPQRVLGMFALSLYSGMRSGGTDNAAHAGGMLGGFLLGIVVCFILYRKDRRTTSEY